MWRYLLWALGIYLVVWTALMVHGIQRYLVVLDGKINQILARLEKS